MTVEVLVVNGTIDAKMAKACVDKANLADAALDAITKQEAIQEAPTVPDWKPLATKRELESTALLVTADHRAAVAVALGQLAGQCDGALKLDGAGFNRMDSAIGKALAMRSGCLTDKQVVMGAKLVRRYQRQLDHGLVERATSGLVGSKQEKGNE